MLLALDVGNTNITIGVFKRKEIIEVFRITTKLPRTSDEFGILISSLLKEKGLDEGEVKAAIIGSVVPNIMHSLSSGLIKYFDVKPIIVGPGIKTGINLGRFNPREVGADGSWIWLQDMKYMADQALVIDVWNCNNIRYCHREWRILSRCDRTGNSHFSKCTI